MNKAALPASLGEALPVSLGFPFRGVALGVLVAVLVLELLSRLPIAGIVFGILAFLLPIKYGMEVLRDTAHGNADAPEFAINFSDMAVAKSVLMAVLCGIAALLAGLVVHPLAGLGVLGLVALVMPVMMMTLAIDESLRHAINPLHWGRVITTIGPPYAAAVILLAVAFVASGAISGTAQIAIGGVIAQLLGALVRAAAFLAVCHLLGWLVWTHRDALGFAVSGAQMSAQARFSKDDRLLDAVAADLANGDADAAIARIAADMKERAVRADVHQRYRDLLRAAGDTRALLDHGRQWLHQRLVEGDRRGAVALAQQCFELDRDFAALTPDNLIAVADQAERMGLAALRLACLRGLAFQGIGESGWPEWLAAWIEAHRQRHEGTAALRDDLVLLSSRCRKPEHRDAVEATLRTLP